MRIGRRQRRARDELIKQCLALGVQRIREHRLHVDDEITPGCAWRGRYALARQPVAPVVTAQPHLLHAGGRGHLGPALCHPSPAADVDAGMHHALVVEAKPGIGLDGDGEVERGMRSGIQFHRRLPDLAIADAGGQAHGLSVGSALTAATVA